MQRRHTSNAWHVGVDVPQELVFLGILAQQHAYRVPEVAAPASAAEAAWQHWWQELPLHTHSVILDQVRQHATTNDRVALSREAFAASQQWFDPPNFTSRAEVPELQKICQAAWPEFSRSWQTEGGEGQARLGALQDDIIHIKLGERLAAAWHKQAPKEAPLQFHLTAVLWPDSYERWLSSRHLLCSLASISAPEEQARLIQRIIEGLSGLPGTSTT